MTAPALVPPTDAPSACLASALYRLTVRQYDRIIDDGTIDKDERVELIEGLLVSKTRRDRDSIIVGNQALRILWRIMPAGWHVAKGIPIVASAWSKPQPDLSVIRGGIEDYDHRALTAENVGIVVEIASASRLSGISPDRSDIPRVHAAAGIPVYWIINLVADQVEIRFDPRPDGYQSHQVFARGQDVPVVIAGVEVGWIAVADLLP